MFALPPNDSSVRILNSDEIYVIHLSLLTRLSERTCKRRVKKMAERGILEVYSDRVGRTNGNRYKIHVDNACGRPKKQRALGRQGESATEFAENAAKYVPPIKAGT